MIIRYGAIGEEGFFLDNNVALLGKTHGMRFTKQGDVVVQEEGLQEESPFSAPLL